MPTVRPEDLPWPAVNVRRLPWLRPGFRSGTAGLFHGGDVRQLCAGNPADRPDHAHRVSGVSTLVNLPARLARLGDQSTAFSLDLAVLSGDLDPLRSVDRP